jgi:hypothetical protein
MKKLACLLLLVFISPLSLACDETCAREKAMAEHQVKFPSYLDSKYCRTTTVDFLTTARRSLQQYLDERLDTAHRGGMRNIRNFIEQRREWLQECDQYLNLTNQGRIFRTKETTDQIFSSINSLSEELDRLIKIRRTAEEDPLELTTGARQKFQILFKNMDDHRTDLQLRGLL